MFQLFLSLFLKLKGNKYFYIIIGIILIVAVLFLVWDPLNFRTKHPKIGDTALSVKEIKQIGELITAKYYGEVYASLNTESETMVEESFKQGYEKIANTYQFILKNNCLDSKTLTENRKADFLIRKDYRFNKLIKNERYKLLKSVSSNKDDIKFLIEVSQKNYDQFYKDYKSSILEMTKKYNQRALKNADISYIARGEVIAGYNLNELKEENMEIDNNVLYLKLTPFVYANINPWFIENEVPGFEIISQQRANRITFDQLKFIKQKCEDKLENNALASKILEQAKGNAENTLINFIGLFDKEGTINSIIIEHVDS